MLQKLPTELVDHILDYEGVTTVDYLHVARTCKRLSELVLPRIHHDCELHFEAWYQNVEDGIATTDDVVLLDENCMLDSFEKHSDAVR